MNTKVFEEILEFRLAKIKSVLSSKAKEYAKNDDRLHNFNRAATILKVDRRHALLGMFVKHIVSLLDIVDTFETTTPTKALIDEKIGDSINYLILLEAMLTEDICLSTNTSVRAVEK